MGGFQNIPNPPPFTAVRAAKEDLSEGKQPGVSFHKAMYCTALLFVVLERIEEEKQEERWAVMGICKKKRIYFDVSDLSQNTRRLNFPERKFSNKETQKTFRC